VPSTLVQQGTKRIFFLNLHVLAAALF